MKDMTKGNIYKTFLLFAVPLILSGVLSQSYGIIDTVVVGKLLNSNCLAAIGATSPFIQFFLCIFWGYVFGFSIYIANLFGAREYKKLKTAVYVNFSVILVSIFVLSIISVIFKDFLFEFLAVDPEIRSDTSVYFIVYMLGGAFLIMNTFAVYTLSAFGITVYPLLMSVLMSVLHIFGNFFAVKVLKFGVGGIAASAVFSAAVADICYFTEIRKCFKKMGVGKYRIKFGTDTIKECVRFSVPTTVQQTIMYVSSLAVSPMVNNLGGSASAAYIICLKIFDFNASIYQNSAKTVSNYLAQSIGAGKYNNINRGLRAGFVQGVVLAVPFLTVTVIFAKELCMLFLSSENSHSAEFDMAFIFVRYFIPFIFFNLICNLFHSFYRGVAAMQFLVISTSIGSISRIVATYFLLSTYGMNGVYIGWAISWIAECIFTLVVYCSGRWKSADIKNFERGCENTSIPFLEKTN